MNTKWLFLVIVASLLLTAGPVLRAAEAWHQYVVSVGTMKCEDAGTDANVTLRLCGRTSDGKQRCTPLYQLDCRNCNNFESGSLDVIELRTELDFTGIDYIQLAHDNSGKKPGWLPAYVDVSKVTGGRWHFCIQRWLAKDEGDRQISIATGPPSSNCAPPQHAKCALQYTFPQTATCRGKARVVRP